jgi:hypothetical protein
MTDNSGSTDGEHSHSGDSSGEKATTGRFLDTVFEALSDWRRREICQYFLEADATTATVTELALLIEAYESGGENGPTRAEITDDLRDRHLPRLERAGAVEYDTRSGTVRYRGQPTVEKWLEHAVAVEERIDNDCD